MKTTLLCATVLLMAVSASTKVCVLRNEESKCSVRGEHVSEEEAKIIEKVCEEKPSSANLLILNTRNTELTESNFYETNCPDGLVGSHVWLTWNEFLTRISPNNKFSEGNIYLGRNVLKSNEMELCQIDFQNGHCISLVGENSQNVIWTDVLVQRLPTLYELRHISESHWKNITEINDVILTATNLSNHGRSTQFVQKIVPYDLERTVQIDLPGHLEKGRFVNVYENGKLSLNFVTGDTAQTLITKSVAVIKRLLPRTSVEATLRGVQSRILSQINGNLITVFDKDDNHTIVQRFTNNITTNKIEDEILNVYTEFGIFIKLDPSIEVEEEEEQRPNVEDSEVSTQSSEVTSSGFLPEHYAGQLFQPSGPIYPGFRTISTGAALLFCSVFCIAMFDVFRKITGDRRAKRSGSYKIVQTNEKIY